MISRTAVLENYVWTELSSRNTDDAGNGGSDEAAHYWVLEKGAHVEVDSIRAPVDALEIRSRSTAEDFPAQLKHEMSNLLRPQLCTWSKVLAEERPHSCRKRMYDGMP